MRTIPRQCTKMFILVSSSVWCMQLQAQSVTGSLIDLVNSGRFEFNRLEVQAAIANQAAYNELAPSCDPRRQPTPATCTAAQMRVFENARELVENANELLGSGATEFSLGLDEEGVGFALRWTAAEELAAQTSAGREFANSQLTSLMSRMTALRHGATGFSVAQPSHAPDALLANELRPLGGGAAADTAVPADFSRWGGFIDGSYGWGDRAPSDVEDAFDFDGTEVTVGLDYRFTSRLVAGTMLGYTDQLIDFDSRRSVVDGEIASDGYSVMVYGLYERDGPYVSASLGWQQLGIETVRRITYPSFNPDVDSIDATASGDTDSSTVSASLNAGWSWYRHAFGVEPYLRAEYRDISLDGFQESSVHNRGPARGLPAGFDFRFDDQSVTSLQTVVGLRLQYALTPRFGVVVPYLKGEYHRQLDDDPNQVSASYNLDGAGAGLRFDVVGDEPDQSFHVFAAGLSVVLQRGWQGFLQYQTVRGLDLLTNDVITGGIRAEF
jgi:outer membrane autotransporter protein